MHAEFLRGNCRFPEIPAGICTCPSHAPRPMVPAMHCTPYGPHALLFTFAESVGDEASALGAALLAELERDPPPGMVEAVPAFTTLLLEFSANHTEAPHTLIPGLLRRFGQAGTKLTPRAPVKELPVCYNGEDLETVARSHDLSTAEIIRLHSEPVYKVYLLGFSPGFPYLGDLHPLLHTPRLATPRARIAAGSVAIGGEHTGIYSVDSPGGWNILGHTSVKMFDTQRRPDQAMFLLHPGDRVKFLPAP